MFRRLTNQLFGRLLYRTALDRGSLQSLSGLAFVITGMVWHGMQTQME